MIHERPIIFSAPMVRAILSGKKTRTTRLVDLKRLKVRLPFPVANEAPAYAPDLAVTAEEGTYHASINPQGAVSIVLPDGKPFGLKPGEFTFVCPYAEGNTHLGNVGGGRQEWMIEPPTAQLWVREAWGSGDGFYQEHECDPPKVVVYRADGAAMRMDCSPPQPITEYDTQQWNLDAVKWKSPLFLPRISSRIDLQVTAEVRLRRLSHTTFWEIREEGIDCPEHDFAGGFCSSECPDLRAAFYKAWDEMHKEPGTTSKEDPWTWTFSFRRVRP